MVHAGDKLLASRCGSHGSGAGVQGSATRNHNSHCSNKAHRHAIFDPGGRTPRKPVPARSLCDALSLGSSTVRMEKTRPATGDGGEGYYNPGRASWGLRPGVLFSGV